MSASADVESQSVVRPRGRCLDAFLTTSVVLLFVMFLVALGGALLFAKHLESEINTRMPRETDGSVSPRIAPSPLTESENSYKVQNFAHLRATNSELKPGVMKWETIEYGEGESIGSLYQYEEKQSVLNVMASGSYFLYAKLTFYCVHVCPPAHFNVIFYDQLETKQLTCSVSLPDYSNSNASHPVTRTCWQVVTLLKKESRLLAKTEFTEELTEKQKNWRLELNDSGFGMFLVDG
nr:uncharacterized protein LOC129445382 [Misgurnus anguillicaudatus]